MLKLNFDVLFLILEKLQDDVSFHSLLLVNKTWSQAVVPILWKNPWKYLIMEKEHLLLDVIISHLSDKTRDNFQLTGSYKKPLFNYISHCKHLNLCELERIIDDNFDEQIIKDEIFRLFINENMKITHLYLQHESDHQSHQIHLLPGAEICLSSLESLHCSTYTDNDVIVGLSKICKSIKEIHVVLYDVIDNGIIKLIEGLKKLNIVRFHFKPFHRLLQQNTMTSNKLFRKNLENSLIKHANNIQHFSSNKNPLTKILSSFKSLKSLEINEMSYNTTWNNLENVSLPCLQILNVRNIPFQNLLRLFENAKGLHEIKVGINRFNRRESNKMLIQSIHQNCPNLKYLGIPFENDCVSELENLLTKCQLLNGLYIFHVSRTEETDWSELFEILAKSSPKNLYKFKFQSSWNITLDSFKMFFYYWKGRRPMLLQTIRMRGLTEEHFYLFENNEFLEVIEKYHNDKSIQTFEDFEWIKPISSNVEMSQPWFI